MVSLDLNSSYLKGFADGDDEMGLFRAFIANEPVPFQAPNSGPVLELVWALAHDDSTRARALLQDFAEKKPDSTSHFIYKDVLVFLLICAAKRFTDDLDWLNRLLSLRRSDEPEKNRITSTFKNLVTDNFTSNDNLFAINIVYKHLTGSAEAEETALNSVIEETSLKIFPIYSSAFLNLVTLRAIELVLTYKGIGLYNEASELRSFTGRFRNRTWIIALMLALAILTTVVVICAYYTWLYLYGDKEASEAAGKMLTVFGVVFAVLAIAGVAGGRKIVDLITGLIQRMLGYNILD